MTKGARNNLLIDIYYDLYDYYQDDELVINAIYYLMRRNNRTTIKSIIRKDLNKLNLIRYEKALHELSTYHNIDLDKFKLDNLANLNNILSILHSINELESPIQLQSKKLEEIILICQKLKK